MKRPVLNNPQLLNTGLFMEEVLEKMLDENGPVCYPKHTFVMGC